MSQTVADVFVRVLQQVGVKQVFGLIGDSLNPLADAIRRSDIEWIGVHHEEGAALAASGQAKLTGRLAVCAGTTGPGSTHLVAGLYEGSRDHAPVLALSGDMPRQMHGTDYIQTTEPDLLFSDVCRSIPRPSPRRHRHQPSFIRPSRPLTQAAASPI
jgi:pyruvate dehydrogenase (quinone)